MAFPEFWPSDPNSPAMQQQFEEFKRMQVDLIYHNPHKQRRFSGWEDLPKGRYYSVCSNDRGEDEGTLVNELNAYLDPTRGGLLLFADMVTENACAHARNQYGFQGDAGPYLLFIFLSRPGAPSPFIRAASRAGLFEGACGQEKETVMLGTTVPYSVSQQVIDNVLDLRTLEAQRYILQEFALKDTEYFKKADRTGATAFVHLLPTLLASEHGGDHFTNAIGAFARQSCINAIVYPSARSNCSAVQRDGTLISAQGWNLVDYRGAPALSQHCTVDISKGWPTRFPSGATITHQPDGEYKGSWRVEGLVEWHRHQVGMKEQSFLDHVKNAASGKNTLLGRLRRMFSK